jgi:predicted ATP-dependent endonuclease of OLD family
MNAAIWLKSITFHDAKTFNFQRNDIVVIVGPNNSGKSETLRNIQQRIEDTKSSTVIINDLQFETEGSDNDLQNWMETNCREHKTVNGFAFSRQDATVHTRIVKNLWNNKKYGLKDLTKFFSCRLSADARLKASDPPVNIDLINDRLTHPIHYLQYDDKMENEVSAKFRIAFKKDLIINHNSGKSVPLHVGNRPKPKENEDRVSRSYLDELQKLPMVHQQGDGMRAYTGILLNTQIMDYCITLLDEPEAFLHPPQVRHLARILAKSTLANQQLIIATHSGDFLRALLDADISNRVRVLRIDREGDVNNVNELNNKDVRALWSDPLLRYSNILDGLFHEKVIVTEGDSDCRFYSALRDVNVLNDPENETDIMFTHCGGKARLHVVVKALRTLKVPIAVVSDIDILNDEYPLKSIMHELGGDWSVLEKHWKIVKLAVDQKKGELKAFEVSAQIKLICDKAAEEKNKELSFPKSAIHDIEVLMKRSSPWSIIKTAGISYIPSGDATLAFLELDKLSKAIGLFIVPVGEVEGFDRSVGNHGPKWINEVLEKDLSVKSFVHAREFVSTFCSLQ